MIRILIPLFLVSLLGCGKSSPVNSTPLATPAPKSITPIVFNEENFIYKNDSVPFNGKRLYFIHGCLTCDHNSGLMDTPAYAKLVTDLNNNGWQVVEFDLPLYSRDYWLDGGLEYSQKFSKKLEQSVLWADQNYGAASVNVVGGISYGSLHALMSPSLTDKFSGYFGVLCLVPLENLTEYANEPVPFFNPSTIQSMKALEKLKGFMVWNTSDSRVGYLEAQNLFNTMAQAGSNIQSHIYNEGDHTINGDNLNYIFDWMTNNF